jgi:hypothetical protein
MVPPEHKQQETAMNSQFEIREISIETLDRVVGGKSGDGSGTGTGTGHGGSGLVRIVRSVVEPIVDAVGGALGALGHIF